MREGVPVAVRMEPCDVSVRWEGLEMVFRERSGIEYVQVEFFLWKRSYCWFKGVS